MSGQPIVVGVDGGPDSLRAVDYAANAAQTRRAPLKIVAVVDSVNLLGMPLAELRRESLISIGQGTVDSARRRAVGAGLASDQVSTEVLVGHAPTVLAGLGTNARAIVLGRRELHGLDRVFSGSTSLGVAARSRCPVVVVPHGWTSTAPAHQQVGVGIDGTSPSTQVLRGAFEEASSRRVGLTVILAWEPPPMLFAGSADYKDALAIWADSVRIRLAETLAGWRQEYPDVQVRRVFVRDHPATVLADASKSLDVLVIGAGDRRSPGQALGPVARAVVGHTACPVIVQGSTPAAGADGPSVERAEVGSPR